MQLLWGSLQTMQTIEGAFRRRVCRLESLGPMCFSEMRNHTFNSQGSCGQTNGDDIQGLPPSRRKEACCGIVTQTKCCPRVGGCLAACTYGVQDHRRSGVKRDCLAVPCLLRLLDGPSHILMSPSQLIVAGTLAPTCAVSTYRCAVLNIFVDRTRLDWKLSSRYI